MNSQELEQKAHRQYASRNLDRKCEINERRFALIRQINKLSMQLLFLDDMLYENKELQKAMNEGYHIAMKERDLAHANA